MTVQRKKMLAEKWRKKSKGNSDKSEKWRIGLSAPRCPISGDENDSRRVIAFGGCDLLHAKKVELYLSHNYDLQYWISTRSELHLHNDIPCFNMCSCGVYYVLDNIFHCLASQIVNWFVIIVPYSDGSQREQQHHIEVCVE